MAIASSNSIRVLIVDCKQLWGELLVEKLQQRDRFAAVHTSPEHLLETLAEVRPDVLLLEAERNHGACATLELLHAAHKALPSLRSAVLVNSFDGQLIRDSFFAGATGAISPDEPFDTLVQSIECVYARKVWLRTDQFACFVKLIDQYEISRAITDACESELLTTRQLNLVKCVAKGMTNREIALELDLSEHTVRNYLVRIFKKFGVSNRAELVCSTMHHPHENYSAAN